jgi:hypothetical protein
MGWLCLEGVLNLLAGILQAGLSLIRPAFGPGVVIPGGLADGLFGPAAQVFNFVLQFVFGAHVFPTSSRRCGIRFGYPAARDVETPNGDPAAAVRGGLQAFSHSDNGRSGKLASRRRRSWTTRHAASTVTMEFVSTAIVVAVVATLMLLGIGMVVNQLLRLKKFLKDAPPDAGPGGEVREPPHQPH